MILILAIMVGAALVVLAAVAYTHRSREKIGDPTSSRKEVPSSGVRDQKENIVNYVDRFLFGKVPRLRSGAVFLAVAALGIFISGCNKTQATTTPSLPDAEVTPVQQP